MPIEIFISYRRKDTAGHARALHRALREAFDRDRLFFDHESIESGQQFPERIRDGVRQCRVFLALIGPDWLMSADGDAPHSSATPSRLHDPADFVRQEIALALAEGKTVIPVLFDDTPLPARDALPEPLRTLLDCDALTLSGKNFQYEAQLQELVRLACKAGAEPLPAARSAPGVAADREKLVYLCDRSAQDSHARDTLRELIAVESRRPFVLVVHGRVEEAHHAFVERLAEFSLPRVLKGCGLAQGIRFVDVFEELPLNNMSAFERRLRERLADRLDAPAFENDRAIVELIGQRRLGALVAVMRWRASELGGDASMPLKLLHEYWSKFPDLDRRTVVGCIVCLKYDKAPSSGGLLRRLFGGGGDDDRAQALRDAVLQSAGRHANDTRVVWRVLEELPSVTVADLDRWVDEVRPHVGRLSVTEEQLHGILQGEPKPMEAVLPHLEDWVAQR